MKPQLTLIMALFFTLSSWGQSLSEKEAVLQKCIKLPEVQEQLNNKADGTDQTVYIMQHAVTFPENLDLTESEIELQFMSKDEIYNNKTEAFLRFDKFDVNGTNAEVAFDYEYNRYSTGDPGRIIARLSLKKQQSGWIITKSNLK